MPSCYHGGNSATSIISLSVVDEHTFDTSPRTPATTPDTIAIAIAAAPTPRRIGIYHHPKCHDHCIPDHPEQPDRVTAILDALKRELPEDCFRLATEASEEQLLLFHSQKHVGRFMKLCDRADAAKNLLPKSKRYISIDSDTVVMHATRQAALLAAGSICNAIDDIFNSKEGTSVISPIDTAFCCVRPPGHHAETDKACGFCFLNNAGIGARYAQARYGMQRVAVLDFDVHHGNGTEENFAFDETCFYGSTHEKDNFPGTGPEPHLVGSAAVNPVHRRIVNRQLNRGPRSRREFREKWSEVLEEMTRFDPDFVVISAGFDAHSEDPLADCELLEEDFAWATTEVLQACADARPDAAAVCLSILEGGYDLCAISSSAVAHVLALQEGCMTKKVGHGGDEVAALQSLLDELGI